MKVPNLRIQLKVQSRGDYHIYPPSHGITGYPSDEGGFGDQKTPVLRRGSSSTTMAPRNASLSIEDLASLPPHILRAALEASKERREGDGGKKRKLTSGARASEEGNRGRVE